MSLLNKHGAIERNVTLLFVLSFVVVTIGGIVEIAPLFWIKNTIETVKGMRPYTPLELAGRDIYVREGCYVCHTQMIRPFRDEVERYGHYSLAAESQYDHPFQWGSKRTGPDLARVGGKYSDDWHVDHLIAPEAVVPDSIMPSYAFLAKTPLGYKDISAKLKTLSLLGTPYSEDMIANAMADLKAQLDPDSDTDGLTERYTKNDGKAPNIRDFDGNVALISEMDALVAYLQVLGTMVDFEAYKAEENLR